MKKINILIILYFFLRIKAESPVVILSPPKCGTHIALKCAMLITDQKHFQNKNLTHDFYTIYEDDLKEAITKKQIYNSHAIANHPNTGLLKQYNVKAILILRDPRDQIISYLGRQYTQENWNKWITHCIQDYIIINHIPGFPLKHKVFDNINGIKDFYTHFLPWMELPFVYTTYFEKIVGPKGGGNEQMQIQEIMNIAQYIEYPITKERATQIAKVLFGTEGIEDPVIQEGFGFSGQILRPDGRKKGQIGSWKYYFKGSHKNLFKTIANDLLISLGYEKDLNW